jgi:hypothetical protein
VTPQLNATPSEGPRSITSSAECLPPSTLCSLSQQVTIEELSKKMLLNIFGYFLDDSPGNWPILMHICHKWRRIVFASQRPLQLRLFCTYATPVLKTLDCWPTLPIVVEYGGSPALNPPAPEDEDSIVAALKQSDRVASISLTVTSSLLERLSEIERPFSKLEGLVLLCRGGMRLTLPNTFQCGPRLRFLYSTRIVFPALLQLLYPSKNLVYLHLHKVLSPFPPETLTNALSGMDRLRSLSLHLDHFPSTADHLSQAPPPSPGKLVVLPALTRLNFQGITRYLTRLVAGIDAPLLRDIEVTFLMESRFDLLNLRQFTERIGMHESPCRADILSSERAMSISLSRPGDQACFKFQVILNPLSAQLFFMAQICVHFSALFSNVEDLFISIARHPRQEDRFDSERWLESLNSFAGVKWFRVVGNLSTHIVRALQQSDTRGETVLPALHELHISQPGPPHATLRQAVVSLLTSRQVSGHPIVAEYERIYQTSDLTTDLRRTGAIYARCHRHYSLTRLIWTRILVSAGHD